MKKSEELQSFNLTAALANDNKPKSAQKSEPKAAETLEMEPKQREQTTKSTGKLPVIPLPLNSNMDENHNNNTKTTSTRATTNADKNNDGVKAPKRGRQSSKKKLAPPADEEMLVSPPQKKPPIIDVKGMEVCEIG
jgi:Flp pilus assembly protein CpaB